MKEGGYSYLSYKKEEAQRFISPVFREDRHRAKPIEHHVILRRL